MYHYTNWYIYIYITYFIIIKGNLWLPVDNVKYVMEEGRSIEAIAPPTSCRLSLHITRLTLEDFGHYTCFVDNPRGDADATITLYGA